MAGRGAIATVTVSDGAVVAINVTSLEPHILVSDRGHALDSDREVHPVERSDRDALRRVSTARLQEMRRVVDEELAGRVTPHADLRDEKAGRP